MSNRSRWRSRRTSALAAAAAAAATVAAMLPAPPASAAAASTDACVTFEAKTRQDDPQLGAGVTLGTGVEGNLFPAGSAPSLRVVMADPGADGQSLHLTVRNDSGTVSQRDVTLSAADQAAETVTMPATPGWFKVSAERREHGKAVGRSCLWYGVAMPGADVDLNTLPPGKDWGGPAASRDVLLHAQLGLPVVRRQIDVAQFLANPTTDQSLAAAAQQAAQLGLKFVVQIGQGGAAEKAAVAKGTWGDLVKQIVAANPDVTYWEAWNEPNTSMFFDGTPADYVQKVLGPFAKSVHAANHHAKVVGGSALGEDNWWWGQFASLGGFKLVDVIGIHPYTWQWGPPETKGMQSILELVRALADKNGGHGKPIFDTESAFPSTWQGTDSTIWTQADFIARKLVVERALGVESSEYLLEGGWQDWDVIDYSRGVKPGAMTLTTTGSLLAGRKFLGWWDTGVDGVQAARFAGSKTDHRGLTVVWSSGSGANRKVGLRCAVTGHDAYGAAVRATSTLTATGSPVFLSGGSPKDAGCVTGQKASAPTKAKPVKAPRGGTAALLTKLEPPTA